MIVADAPVSSRHQSVIGFALPNLEFSFTYTIGRKSCVFIFLVGDWPLTSLAIDIIDLRRAVSIHLSRLLYSWICSIRNNSLLILFKLLLSLGVHIVLAGSCRPVPQESLLSMLRSSNNSSMLSFSPRSVLVVVLVMKEFVSSSSLRTDWDSASSIMDSSAFSALRLRSGLDFSLEPVLFSCFITLLRMAFSSLRV
jgi:hypothetical protein